MQLLNGAYFFDFVRMVAVRYGIFMVLYLAVTYIVYQFRYSHGRKLVKGYYKNLKEVSKIYEREDKLKSPAQHESE